jgi:hypothetical protein
MFRAPNTLRTPQILLMAAAGPSYVESGDFGLSLTASTFNRDGFLSFLIGVDYRDSFALI